MLNKAAGKKELIRAAITVVAGLFILGLFIIAFGGHRFWEKLDTYVIRFNGVKNLDVGRPVKYAGINVGRVLEIAVDGEDPSLVRVVVGLQEGFTVYEGTMASISQKGIVGDNFVLLNLSRKAGPPLKPGSEIPPELTPDLMELAASMATMAANLQPKISEIAESLRELLNNDNRQQVQNILSETTAVLKEAHQMVGSMNTDVRTMTQEASAGIRETREFIGETRQNMNAAMNNLNSAITGVHGDTAATLQALRSQIGAVGGSITTLSNQLQKDLDYDQRQVEEILDNTAELTHNLKVLTQSLKERPWQVIYRPDDRKKE
ncbi:MlaD family protein [Desulfovibrio mangrovi]|uniref:MlaD family protein n=1 Tax=Desulfovibrio mangrovi TaxID=2976983 RepID=UPI002246426F|nr:MlaD family protein [Desulfovibrio mangrovi]UZP66552.1 MlaD family protein [Desulfovibrio mangrovi]